MSILLPDGVSSSADSIGDVLSTNKTIAVVGLSSNPRRPSHDVAAYLKMAGYKIIPVNPNETEVLGEKAYARLEDVPEPIDIVEVFRRPDDVPPVVESAIGIGAKVLWLQQGITSPASEKARAAGMVVVEDACMLVEHKRRRATRG